EPFVGASEAAGGIRGRPDPHSGFGRNRRSADGGQGSRVERPEEILVPGSIQQRSELAGSFRVDRPRDLAADAPDDYALRRVPGDDRDVSRFRWLASSEES